MKVLEGLEEVTAMKFLQIAALQANYSPCYRSKCGAIIVKDDVVIGVGYNAPPGGEYLEKCFKDDLPKDFKSDKTCCVHAEQNAIMNALKENPKEIIDSRLYFIRLNEDGKMKKSSDPYCTICSKMSLEAGISEFVLFREEGVCVYDTKEYNKLSFQFGSK